MSSQIISLLREQRALQSVVQQLESVQRTSIRIVPTVSGSPQALPLGCSRLGGRPHLPKGLPWPLSKLELPSWLAPSALNIPVDSHGFFTLPFVAQIRMDDLMPYDSDRLLPAAGIIYFFYAGSDYDSENDNASYWRVLWIEETNELENAAPPVPLLESAIYRSCTVSFQNETTLPHVETCWIGAQKNEHAKIVLNREQWHAYADFLYKQRAKQRICQMLGHSDDCQPYALERGYDHVQNQLFAGEPTLSGAALQEQLEQSRLLLQVDAVGNGMRFGRDGRLFFFIREADLKRKDFTKVWTMEQ